jgi:3-dehydroquinate synthase
MRGVPLILIPTTLLAMVDAAIGGKTGLDTPYGKNLIGAFYPPEAIFIEPHFLTSLPEKEMKNGQSEIVKYGLIWNEDILEMDLPNAIAASIEAKLEIVKQDPYEKGLRRILNFGHTIGHALEHLCGLSHGEAVALGCFAESRLSWMHGYLKEWKEVSKPFPKFDPVKLKQVLTLDKKAKGGIPRFVMLDRIGHCLEFGGEYCSPTHLLDELIDWMLHGRD